jgi:cytochrome c peroxidase
LKKYIPIVLFCAAISIGFFVQSSNELIYPDYFPDINYNIERNNISADKINLGRALFFDPILSKDNTVSCASCHSPYNAFAHTDHDLSHGIDDNIGTRNAPALFNLAWNKSFMWDGAINHLDMQALAPITSENEMGSDINHVTKKLQDSHIYPSLFLKSFGDSVVTGEHILKALSQFQLTLISADSKYDQVKKGEEIFSAKEENGYAIFKKECNSCHSEPLFTNLGFANNGLDIDSTLIDYGKMNVTKNPKDSMLFKVPSLRNLSYTFPYMHDGRFRKLNQVLDRYQQITPDKNLSGTLEKSIQLNPHERIDLISFLLTLNDSAFVFNPKHQYPLEILNPTKD